MCITKYNKTSRAFFNLDSKLSVKFQYYNARSIANQNKIEDEGSSNEDNLKSVILYRYICDLFHPYDLKQINEKPTHITYDVAMKNLKSKRFSISPKKYNTF